MAGISKMLLTWMLSVITYNKQGFKDDIKFVNKEMDEAKKSNEAKNFLAGVEAGDDDEFM